MSTTPPNPDPMSSPMGLGTGPSQDEKTHAMLCWLLSFVSSFIAPLIFFLISNDKPFVKRHAAMCLGLHLSVMVGCIIGFFLIFILIGFLILPAIGLFSLVCTIMGAIAASKGENYEVPVLGKMIAKMFGV